VRRLGTGRRHSVDVERTEMVEGEIDVFIARRDRERRKDEGERAAEEMYEESCRRHSERVRQEDLWKWKRHHEAMIRAHEANLAAVVGAHKERLARVDALLGISDETEAA
jgi:hypothetical protein